MISNMQYEVILKRINLPTLSSKVVRRKWILKSVLYSNMFVFLTGSEVAVDVHDTERIRTSCSRQPHPSCRQQDETRRERYSYVGPQICHPHERSLHPFHCQLRKTENSTFAITQWFRDSMRVTPFITVACLPVCLSACLPVRLFRV